MSPAGPRAGGDRIAKVLSPLLVVALALAAPAAMAQQAWDSGRGQTAQAPVFKYYVWGQVRSPGAYSLGANADLVELISAAGGPTGYANLDRVTVVRAVSQKRVRVNLNRVLGAGEVYRLSPGDVVIVSGSPWYYIRDGITVAGSVGALVVLVLTIMSRFEN